MRRAERKHEWLICCAEVSLTAPQKRNHPAGGFFFCVHFTPQSRLRLDGRSISGLLLFTSTPQSIAKPSPGWNKVALLTAVRNSHCSCPFSVSLNRPQDALNSEPRVGGLLVLLTTSPVHTPLAYFTWRSHISLRISAISPCASRISLRTKVRFTPSPPPPRRYFL